LNRLIFPSRKNSPFHEDDPLARPFYSFRFSVLRDWL
jgi:hypothetical protein